MKVLLVAAKGSLPEATPNWVRIPQLSLPVLAGLTPPGHRVETVEEEFEPLPRDEHWDLVGISAMTPTATRAYELAKEFRRAGSKVVLGGIHPSVLPDEAMRFADAVVVGEAEGIWPKVLADAEAGHLQRCYRNSQPDISDSPLPVRKKMRGLGRLVPRVLPVMASRGCPHDCEFCCVHEVFGRRQRHVPVEHVVEDIRRSGAKIVMFLDDNVGGDRPYATKLFEAIAPLKIRWYAQGAVRLILDGELFRAAVRSGMVGLFVGIESIEPDANKKLRKLLASVEQYEEAARRCRLEGVIFHASLVFGLDEQRPDIFDRTLDFLERNSVPSISACMLTPYPGTRLFERLTRERRILHTNWAYYDHGCVCFQPKAMSPEELSEKYLDFRRRFFSFSSIFRRAYAQLRVAPLSYLGVNLGFRATTKMMKGHFRNYFKWLRSRESVPSFETAACAPATMV